MIFRSRNDGLGQGYAELGHPEPCHAVPPLLALVLALSIVLLGCGEQVIVGRESATRPPAEALIDAGSYGAQTPARADADNDNDDDDSDGDDDDTESDGEEDQLEEDVTDD